MIRIARWALSSSLMVSGCVHQPVPPLVPQPVNSVRTMNSGSSNEKNKTCAELLADARSARKDALRYESSSLVAKTDDMLHAIELSQKLTKAESLLRKKATKENMGAVSDATNELREAIK